MYPLCVSVSESFGPHDVQTISEKLSLSIINYLSRILPYFPTCLLKKRRQRLLQQFCVFNPIPMGGGEGARYAPEVGVGRLVTFLVLASTLFSTLPTYLRSLDILKTKFAPKHIFPHFFKDSIGYYSS